jgi:hypothetical protein
VLGIQRLALERCPEAIEKLTELMRSAQSERARADAASKILDRGCGKPTQPADGRLDVTYHVRDQPMSLDEWRRTWHGCRSGVRRPRSCIAAVQREGRTSKSVRGIAPVESRQTGARENGALRREQGSSTGGRELLRARGDGEMCAPIPSKTKAAAFPLKALKFRR